MHASNLTALVFGANGISGAAMCETLVANASFSKVIAVSRRPPQLDLESDKLIFVSIDFLKSDVEEIAEKLRQAGAQEATHAFHYAYIAKSNEQESVDVNKEIFGKALDATKKVSKRLEMFQLQTGYKYYGVHKGGKYLAPIPFKESGPRHEGLNFYFVQEDMLQSFCSAAGWGWVITRPNIIIGISKGNFMNLAVTIALYAVICKEEGTPFKFIGNQLMWNNIVDMSSSRNNANFQAWCAFGGEKTVNKIFNIYDGDKLKFSDLWPKIARYFDIPLPSEAEAFSIPPNPGEISPQVPLSKEMPPKRELWMKIAKKYGLDEKAFDYATWDFAEFATGRTWPDDGDMTAAREAGWDVTVDTWEAWKDVFEKMKELKMIPKY